MLINIYKKAFLAGNDAIWWGGDTHYRPWDDNTMYLYFIVVILSFIAAWRCDQRSQIPTIRSPRIKTIISKWFILITGVLLCIMGLRGSWVGMDTIVYSTSFENATSLSAIFKNGSTTEPLYKFGLFILRKLFSSRYLAIFVFSSIIIYFVHKTLTRFYNDICLAIAIPAFVCLYYFQSFNLIRITVAASFQLYSLHLLVDQQYKKFALRILFATMIHYSSIVLFFPLGMLVVFQKNRKLAYCGAALFTAMTIYGTNLLGEYIVLINRYEEYITGNHASGQVGFALFIDYLPCIYLCYYIIKRNIAGQWADMMICFSLTAFIVRMLAYYILAAGRLTFHFMPLTIVILPYWLNYIQKNDSRTYRFLLPVCVVWLFVRLHIYFIGYLAADGIMPYYFFWNE